MVTAHVGSLFHVLRERAKHFATHARAGQLLQGGKGIGHLGEVLEVQKCDTRDQEASDSCEYGEKEWEAGMKREVLQALGGSQTGRRRAPILPTPDTVHKHSFKPWKLPMEGYGEDGERVCCSVEGAPDKDHFADVVG